MTVCFIISAMVWLAAVISAIISGLKKYKKDIIITPMRALRLGTFTSSAIMFLPIYFKAFADSSVPSRIIKTVCLSLHRAIALFLGDANFEIINEAAADIPALSMYFSAFASVLVVSAPILTFVFLVSLLKNMSSYLQYFKRFFRDVYVFSELNERSLALAESFYKKNKRNVIIFTDVFEENEEKDYELAERAKELKAICFKKDILSINFKLHAPGKSLTFFTISDDDAENINQSFAIIEEYKERKDTKLYVFSTSVDGELMMSSANKGEVKVRRIKDVRSLIYRTLYDMENRVIEDKKAGKSAKEIKSDLFMNAILTEDGIKQIGAVVVGCGKHGIEMIKALSWFCQMDGYRVSVDVFDKDSKMESKFAALCPELMDERYNGVYVRGEAQYYISFHTDTEPATGQKAGIETETSEFVRHIKQLTNTTYVFVSLGNDELNIETAVLLRTLFEQMHIHPTIQAVVFNTDKKQALSGIKNFKGQAYDIDFVGDLSSIYSEEVIIDSELEDEALERHLKYGAEEDFWAYEYNYRSSMASALHMRARIACGIAGAEKPEDELNEEEKERIAVLEHCRWNAYMRSEGYIYSGSTDKITRNDLGKMHHDLVNYDALDDKEKQKDRRVGTK